MIRKKPTEGLGAGVGGALAIGRATRGSVEMLMASRGKFMQNWNGCSEKLLVIAMASYGGLNSFLDVEIRRKSARKSDRDDNRVRWIPTIATMDELKALWICGRGHFVQQHYESRD